MATRPRKWPSYALSALEETQAIQRRINDTTRQAQESIDKGHYLKALILLGDIRDAANKTINLLTQAKTGEYEHEQ